MRYVEPSGDTTLDQHMARCRACAVRLSALIGDLEAWHGAAAAGGDEAFGPARLAAQRRGIQQRLGALVPARVLAFPHAARPPRHALLARAAAAVLLFALGGAGVVRVLNMPQPSAARVAARPAESQSAPAVRLTRDLSSDAALEDIDLALARPRTAELRALDEFTPYARDISTAPR